MTRIDTSTSCGCVPELVAEQQPLEQQPDTYAVRLAAHRARSLDAIEQHARATTDGKRTPRRRGRR